MNNKQVPNNQIIPITNYPPEDIKNVSKKKSYSIRKTTYLRILKAHSHINTFPSPSEEHFFILFHGSRHQVSTKSARGRHPDMQRAKGWSTHISTFTHPHI